MSLTDGPADPLFQRHALHEIEHLLRPQFEAGDRMALFAALNKCARHELVMPPWVALAFIHGYGQVVRCELDSWDEAFGLPYRRRKKKQLTGMKRRRNILFAAYFAVHDLHESDPTEHPIGVETFQKVAEQLGSNATEVSKLYYQVLRTFAKQARI